jgi:acyl phosphate:glycerol-3-phosphate acyltransferase
MMSVLFILLAYLIGSVSFAVVVSKLMRLPDPRTYGSHNPGATNVLRSGNKKAAILTLLGDAAKGFVAVMLAKYFAPQFGLNEMTVAAVALAALIGHMLPVFHAFKGGKGVATAIGILFAVQIGLAFGVLLIWIVVFYFSRFVSLRRYRRALARRELFQLRLDGIGIVHHGAVDYLSAPRKYYQINRWH